MSQNYIETKVILWIRHYFTERAHMPTIADLINTEGFHEVIDKRIGYEHSEVNLKMVEQLFPVQNNGNATIRVIENGKEIWMNAKH